MATAADTISSAVTRAADALTGLSHDMWDHPELAFEETRAAAHAAGVLNDAGFSVDAGVAGLDTAFVASIGSGPLVIGICAELDALPGIGHACGHNMIAAAGVGAGLGLAEVADDLGLTVKVFGTPAEENGGGKIIMLEAGTFDGVHAAMMVHPSPAESDVFPTLASVGCDYHFHGKPAHSSMAPHEGVNAADAVTIAQVSIGLLRQHLQPGDQIHGIVTDGGLAANIVPDRSSAHYIIRSPDLEGLHELQPRLDRCFEAGALATGARLEISRPQPPYSEFRHDDELATLYRGHAERRGRTFIRRPTKGAASTDMANLSLLMPTIHPTVGLDCAPAVNHQPEFAAHCRTEAADVGILDSAVALALTAADAATTDPLRERLSSADTDYSAAPRFPWTT